jgi:filamentous hemagglutinin family protein
MVGAISALAGVVLALAPCDQVLAQIIPDGTLGAEGSLVTPDVNINGDLADRIDGGATRGANLFHSFEQFNIGDGQRVYFANPAAIENIFSRVTGTDPSDILGTLGVNGGANLFLLNPNGIIFGENAALDVRGSFVGSTASSIQFEDGTVFSAANPDTPPLLTISVPIGLQYQGTEGDIVVRAGSRAAGEFQVQPGQTLALVGGQVSLEGATVKASGGRVELAGVAASGAIGLNVSDNNLGLTFPEDVVRADISLTKKAFVSTSGEGGGTIQIWGRQVTLTEGSQVETNTLSSEAGGGVTVDASELVKVIGESSDRTRSGLFSETIGTGNAGNLTINTETFQLLDGAKVSTRTRSAGRGGDLTVNASELVEVRGETRDARNGSDLFAQTSGTGKAGNLTINTRQLLILDGAQVSASTFGSGDGGILTVNASESVQVIGTLTKLSGTAGSGLFAQTNRGATGNAGELTINTGQLLVKDGAQVATGVLGTGSGGRLTVNASESVQVIGGAADASIFGSGIFTQVSNSQSIGNAGDMTINTRRLLIQDGATVSAATWGAGKGGNLTVNASDSVQLIGISANGRFPSDLNTATLGTGDAGNLIINTRQLLIQDGSSAFTGTFSEGDGGTLRVNATESVRVIGISQRSGLLTATTGSGIAGDLLISTPSLLVQDRARLSAATFDDGNGGNITVTANTIGVTGGADFRTTTVGKGNAGNINLVVQDRITLAGANSGLFANTTESSSGNGGSIFIDNPRTVLIQDEAQIAVDSQGLGTGGNIEIFADSLTLDNQASLSAETANSTGGNITLSLDNLLLMRRESRISTTAGTAQASGDGGNITIDAGVIAAIPDDNNDITANAFSGQGGRVTLTTQGLYNFLIRSREEIQALLGTDDLSEFDTSQLQTNDITAISQTSPTLSRIPTLNLQGIDPTGGLIELPDLVDVTRLVEQNLCLASVGSEFTITGRGGLPTPPHEPLIAEATWEDWRIDSESESTEAIPSSQVSNNSQRTTEKRTKPIVEAQGWYRDAQGNVILTANPTTVTPHGTGLSSYKCQ